MAGQHAKLSASSYSRWGKCAGSVALAAKYPEGPVSVYAAEGTAAHSLAEMCLRTGNVPDDYMGDTIEADGHKFTVDEGMCEAVQVYLEHVDTRRLEAKSRHKFHVEVKLDKIKKLHPDLGGTADCVVYSEKGKWLDIIDYKHGQGVYVEVDDNGQLMYYALGALLQFPEYKPHTVRITIVQPRAGGNPVRSQTFDAFELAEFGAQLVADAKATEAPDAPLVPGTAQCKWCPARKDCPALEAKSTALIEADFAPVSLMHNPAKMAEALSILPAVEARVKEIRSAAYQMMLDGAEIPGYKLVAKRGTRKWTDPDMVETLIDMMDDGEKFREPAPERQPLRSLATIEKMMGKSRFEKELGGLTVKVSSGYNISVSGDKRPSAIEADDSDFSAVE